MAIPIQFIPTTGLESKIDTALGNSTWRTGGGGLSNSFTATSKADLENVANVGKLAIINSIDLGGQTVNLQEDMTLHFVGDGFSNGTVTGNNNRIEANINTIFASDCAVNGTWNINYVYPQWFDVKGDNATDDTDNLNRCFSFIGNIGGGKIVFPHGTYLVNYTGVNIKSNTVVEGNNSKIKLISNNDEKHWIVGVFESQNVKINNLIIEGDSLTHDYKTRYNVGAAPTTGTYVTINGTVEDGLGKTLRTFSENITITTNDLATFRTEILNFINNDASMAGYTASVVSAGTYDVTGVAGEYTVFTFTSGDTDISTGDLYFNGNTHENGIGLMIVQSEDVYVDGLESYHCIGDSVIVGNDGGGGLGNQDVSTGDMAEGGINTDGVTIDVGAGGYYTTNYFNLTLIATDYFHFWARSWGANYDNAFYKARVFYYDASNNLLEYRDHLMFEHSEKTVDLPTGATKAKVWYMDIVAPAKTGAKIDFMADRFGSFNVTLQNFNLHHSRRQGITGGGVVNFNLLDGQIHHIKGTAPQSGIDLEEGHNKNVYIRGVLFHNNDSNFQSPSGMMTTIEACEFQASAQSNGMSSNTGSIIMKDCVVFDNQLSFDGKSYVENTLFKSCTISDGSTTPEVYNTKTFVNCTFEDVTMSLFRTGSFFGLIQFLGGHYDNCYMPSSSDIIFKDLTYQTNTGFAYAGYFDNCKIDIGNRADFYGVVKNSEIYRSVAATDGTINFMDNFIIKDSRLIEGVQANAGVFYVRNNATVDNCYIESERPVIFGKPLIFLSYDNAIISNTRIRHIGLMNPSTGIAVTGSGNNRIIKCDISTTDANNRALIYYSGTTATYDLLQTVVSGLTLPVDDATNTLGGNIEL